MGIAAEKPATGLDGVVHLHREPGDLFGEGWVVGRVDKGGDEASASRSDVAAGKVELDAFAEGHAIE